MSEFIWIKVYPWSPDTVIMDVAPKYIDQTRAFLYMFLYMTMLSIGIYSTNLH